MEGNKLWLFWKDSLQVLVVRLHTQHITLAVIENNQRLVVSFLYAKCNAVERRILWNDLQS